MILLIDMGNQRLKWALLPTSVSGTSLALHQSLSLDCGVRELADLYGDPESDAKSDSGFSSLPWPDTAPQSIWVSSVSNDIADSALTRYCEKKWRVTPRFVHSPEHCQGLVNHYDRPRQLGVDRWLAALAAYRLKTEEGKAGIVVIDAGTAVTVDLVYEQGFCGGAILPGLKLITDSLGKDTGRIRLDRGNTEPGLVNSTTQPHDSEEDGKQPVHGGLYSPVEAGNRKFDPWATNSDRAVQAGALAAVLGGVRYCLTEFLTGRVNNRTGYNPVAGLPVVVTGGDADRVGADLNFDAEMNDMLDDVRIAPNLVLAGLAITAMANRETGPAGKGVAL